MLDVLGALTDEAAAIGLPPAWLTRVKEALEDGVTSSVRELAHAAGVHEVSLSRAFRRHYGCTIGAYRRRLRLRRVADSIEAGDRGLSRIAHAGGYADHAHMCRDFRHATGMTPTAYRNLARTAMPPG